MAWRFGNKQWTIPFKSQNGTSCHVDIYMRGYTGETVLTLTGAADPFYFEEDDSEDLLNGVIRYRTGYIRVIETISYGSLSQLYPTSAFDRYVEVYYGDELTFNGFIQVQNFSGDVVPVPRVLELPVISPMGLFKKRTFRNTLYMPPTVVTLGDVLNTMLLNSTYNYVYLPNNYGYPDPVSLSMEISSLVVTPWNEEFHHSINIAPMLKVMKSVTYDYIINAICKAFGWICHDTPDALVFTAFDFEGYYCYYPNGHIGDNEYKQDANISATATDLTTYFSLADNDANETTLQPDTGIEISYEGNDDIGDHIFDFQRTYVPAENGVVIEPSFIPDMDAFPNHAEIFSLCNLLPVPNVWELSGVAPLTFDANDKLNVGECACAWNGSEGIMISLGGSYPSGHELFRIRFYIRRRSGQYYGFSYDMKGKKHGGLGGLSMNESDVDEHYIYASFDLSNSDYIEVVFKYRWINNELPQLPAQTLIFISNIKLTIFENKVPYTEYRFTPKSDVDIVGPDGFVADIHSGETNPSISSSITMPISLYRLNDHLLGTSVRQTRITTYPYLFQPRKMLVSKFRYASQLTFPHVRLFTYLNKKWRIIAQRFNPWNDEYELTMQHSSVL